MLLNGHPGGFVFFWSGLPEKGTQFFWGERDLHKNYGVVVILLSFLCNYDNLTLKLHQKKRSYPDEDGFLLADSRLEVLLLKHPKK